MSRRRSEKFIPKPDGAFAAKATVIAHGIARDPARFMLSADDARQITAAASEFREALRLARCVSTRTQLTIMRKKQVRKKSEAVLSKFANVIRANPQISDIDKASIYIYARPTQLNKSKCPQTRPLLHFVRSTGESGLTGGMHILRFGESINPRTLTIRAPTRAKPPGAARVELFVELVPQGEPIPTHPGEMSGGRLWYLGSFTRNPIEVAFPVPAVPMLVVYWARWAGANNDVGPFSRTCPARVEGGFAAAGALPDQRLAPRRPTKCVVTLIERPPRGLERDDANALLLADATTGDALIDLSASKHLPEAA